MKFRDPAPVSLGTMLYQDTIEGRVLTALKNLPGPKVKVSSSGETLTLTLSKGEDPSPLLTALRNAGLEVSPANHSSSVFYIHARQNNTHTLTLRDPGMKDRTLQIGHVWNARAFLAHARDYTQATLVGKGLTAHALRKKDEYDTYEATWTGDHPSLDGVELAPFRG